MQLSRVSLRDDRLSNRSRWLGMAALVAAITACDSESADQNLARSGSPTLEAPTVRQTTTVLPSTPPTREAPTVASPPLDGLSCHPPPNVPSGLGAAFGDGRGPFCVVWRDSFDDETAFRVLLAYSPSGERYTYDLPANTREFLFPEEAHPYLGRPVDECLPRQSYSVSVVAVRPQGETPVGGEARSVECDQRP